MVEQGALLRVSEAARPVRSISMQVCEDIAASCANVSRPRGTGSVGPGAQGQ